jgi:TonB family protein
MTMKQFALAATLLLVAAPLHAQPGAACARRHAPAMSKAVQDSITAVNRAVERAMAEEIRLAARAAGIDHAEGLLILRADSLNQTRIFPAEINFPLDVLREIEPRLQAEVAKLPEAPVCPLLVRIDSARQGPSRGERRPVLINESEIRDYLEAWARGKFNGRLQVVVSGIATRSGRGIVPEIVRSSGDAEMDQFALQLFRVFRFRPATLDGSPVDVWVTIPLTTVS